MSTPSTLLSSLSSPEALSDAYRTAVDAHSIVSIIDLQGRFTYVNDQLCELFGYERDELIGKTARLLDAGSDANPLSDPEEDIGYGHDSWSGEVTNRTKAGDILWFDKIVTPLAGSEGEVVGHLCVRKNITKRKLAEAKLRETQRFQQKIAQISEVGGWSLDLENGELFWAPETKAIHEVSDDYKPTLDRAIEFYAPEARSAVTHAVEDAIASCGNWDLELPLITAKGRSIWVRAVGSVIEHHGKPVKLFGTFQDITQRKLAETLLRDEVSNRHSAEQLLRDLLETLPDAVAAYDENDCLIVCNSAYLDIYAASADAIVPGARFEDILRHGLARGQYADAGPKPHQQEEWLAKRLAAHQDPPDQLTQRLKDGRWLQVREHRSPAGTTVGVRTDITTLKHAEAELRRFAEIDPLTGLLNRHRFAAQLGEMLEEIAEGGHPGAAICLFDLDHFKPINDAYGHDAGDEVLSEVARRLNSVLGPEDFAARLGGDEFVFVMCGSTNRAAYEDVIIALFEAMHRPIMTSVGGIQASLSLGAASIGADAASIQDLMKFADLAQYTAKNEGRGRWHWFSQADAERHTKDNELSKELASHVLSDLEKARELLTFQLFPIVGAQDGEPLGFSADVCWSLEHEQLSGEALYGVAQRSGQVARLGSVVVDAVMQTIGETAERGADAGQLWLSVGADHLRLKSFVDDLERARLSHGLEAHTITIATTESAFAARSAGAIESTFANLAALGYRLALDEFGAGGISPALMNRMGVHAVRLCRHVTDALREENADTSLLRALVGMASALNIDVIARDIDTPRHAAVLGSFGVDALQGGLVGEAVPLDGLTLHLADNARRKLAGLLPSQDDEGRASKADRSAA